MADIYLSDSDKARLAKYQKYEKLFEGSHKAAFSASLAGRFSKEELKTYIACNFAGLLSKVAADFLFGEPVIVDAPDEAKDDQKESVKRIVTNNRLHTLNWETALVTSYKGDALYKVRLGNLKEVGVRDSDGKEMGALIEFVQPDLYFPVLDPDNANVIKEHVLAWKRKVNGDDYLRKEIHTPDGFIKNELWRVKGDQLDGQVQLAVAYPKNTPADQEFSGFDGFTIFHIPNFKASPAHHFGQSDYADIDGLLEEINDRMSSNSRILTKHSNPRLAVPPGVLDENGQVRRESFELFEVASEASGMLKPEYITWDGKLDEAFKQIDKIMEFMFMVTETSPGVFGLDKGGLAESGRALKFKMLRTLSKVKRKRTYFEEALKQALYVAQFLEWTAENPKDKGPEPVDVQLTWQDGLPTDYREEAEIREIELRSSAISTETAVKERNPDWTQDEIEAEIERIDSGGVDFGNAIPSVPLVPETPADPNKQEPDAPIKPADPVE